MIKIKKRMDKNSNEQTFSDHLQELRSRIIKAGLFILVCFIALIYFSNEIYEFASKPLQAFLPNTSMIATEVASPFLTPIKLTFFVSLLISMPYILFQIWSFISPGMYKDEKRLAYGLLISSIILFYSGILFAYYLVFPLVFGFFTSAAPLGIAVMTDIQRYLDFVLTRFFAFSVSFEIPILIFLLTWAGITSPDALAQKRPYVVIGCFVLGMLLTPPDVISQTLLAIPVWLLFELGLLFSRVFGKKESN